jgi:hypothetical protein
VWTCSVSTCEPIGAAVNFIPRLSREEKPARGGARELAARIDGVERGAGNGAIGGDREQIQQAA